MTDLAYVAVENYATDWAPATQQGADVTHGEVAEDAVRALRNLVTCCQQADEQGKHHLTTEHIRDVIKKALEDSIR